MEEARDHNVLSCLQRLEMGALGFHSRDPEELLKKDRLHQLNCRVLTLRMQRNKLKVEVQRIKEAKAALDEGISPDSNGEENGAKSSQHTLPLLMARRTQLKDTLRAHHLIGGYEVVEIDSGRRVCYSLSTEYEDTYLDTYHLELDLTRGVRIHRHDIPPSIPLKNLAQENLETDLPAFLHTLREHVSGLASRLYQLRLIKEQVETVSVMETNPLCSVLVLMCKIPGEEETAMLLSLRYGDPIKALPTRVTLESSDKSLPDEPQWKEAKSLFLEVPPHRVLLALRNQGQIL
ncbi:centromere protein O [Clupea harengus]|uniref:Centromere protein O n=1 Tax=Clupea harengus TaxID=7950 RepID=A0A6P3VPH7_CLUHA|nr:centromere protein O [Clupea harengus]XP_042565604.1 centromere protein O [Clupea harengus]